MRDDRPARLAWLVSSILPFEGEVRGWLRRTSSDRCDIDDVIQETYCRIWSAPRSEPLASPRGYFFQVARSVLIDQYRRARVVRIEAVAEIETVSAMGDEHSPERITAGRRELERLRRLLDALPDRCRRVIEMRKIEGLSQKEIAARLGISENVVENDTARGLRQVLAAYFEEAGRVGIARPLPVRSRSGRKDRAES